MKIKVSEASGRVLDWMVATACGHNPVLNMESHGSIWPGWWERTPKPDPRYRPLQQYSKDPSTAYLLIERECINTSVNYQDDPLSEDMIQVGWKANLWNNSVPGTPGFLQWSYGATLLVAAMRCFVESRMGKEIEVPDEALESTD